MCTLRGRLLSLLVLMCMSSVTPVAAQSADTPPKDLIDRVLRDQEVKQHIKKWKGQPVSIADVAESVVARSVNLDGDGQPAWLVVVNHFFFCGVSGNCDLLIYTPDKGGYRRLFPARMADTFRIPTISAAQLAQVSVGPHRTAGFLDVAWKSELGSMIAPGPTEVVLAYDGQAYGWSGR